ncbi:ECF transporter S component [Bacillus seohaeanensis]|jgi:hypothetical protein|uniref:ECF transporter S component n=1 Tax=Bacillus seohaeanensis TaxID=284580 RepID=A0ABW5RTV7_9BACI
MTNKYYKLTFLSLFIALSAAFGAIKIPAVIGTVALDALPALLAASLFTGGMGAIIAFFGHILSSLYAGFPLGPLHLVIALEMALFVWLFGTVFHKGKKVIAAGIFFIGNSIIAAIPFIFIIGGSFYISILPSLLIGSFLNLTIAHFAYPPLRNWLGARVHE